jgi:hypothetical protein
MSPAMAGRAPSRRKMLFRAVARTVVIVIGVLILILVLLIFIGVIDGGLPRLR